MSDDHTIKIQKPSIRFLFCIKMMCSVSAETKERNQLAPGGRLQ